MYYTIGAWEGRAGAMGLDAVAHAMDWAPSPHMESMGHVSEHVSTHGGETWKGWTGVGSILSPLPGHSPEHVPEEGVGCGTTVLAHPGGHYYAKIHRGRGGLWDP